MWEGYAAGSGYIKGAAYTPMLSGESAIAFVRFYNY